MPSCQSAIAYNSPIQHSIYPFPCVYEFAYVLHHREELDTELRSYKSLLTQIDAAEQTLQQTSEQKVHRAVEELAATVGQEDVRIFYFLQYSMGINLCSYVVACIINNAWLYDCNGSPLHCSCYEKSVSIQHTQD